MLSNIQRAATLCLYTLATLSTAQLFGGSEDDEPKAAGPMAPGPRLYFLNLSGGRALSTTVDGKDLRVIAKGFKYPDGIAVDKAAGYIYVSNMGNPMGSTASGSIQRVNLDGSNLTDLVPPGKTHTAKQMTLVQESSGKKLYWGDREGMKVMRCNVDGSGFETVVDVKGLPCTGTSNQCRHVVGVAVDTKSGFVYWTQKGTDRGGEGSIYRAPLTLKPGETPATRTDVQTLFTKLPEPIDLKWVPELDSLYWADRALTKGGNSVNRVKMAPGPAMAACGAVKELLFSGLRMGIGITVDAKSNSVWATDLAGQVTHSDLEGKNSKVIGSGYGSLVGIDYA